MNRNPRHPIIEQDLEESATRAGDCLADLEGRCVVITGATGMLGAYLVDTVAWLNQNRFRAPCRDIEGLIDRTLAPDARSTQVTRSGCLREVVVGKLSVVGCRRDVFGGSPNLKPRIVGCQLSAGGSQEFSGPHGSPLAQLFRRRPNHSILLLVPRLRQAARVSKRIPVLGAG